MLERCGILTNVKSLAVAGAARRRAIHLATLGPPCDTMAASPEGSGSWRRAQAKCGHRSRVAPVDAALPFREDSAGVGRAVPSNVTLPLLLRRDSGPQFRVPNTGWIVPKPRPERTSNLTLVNCEFVNRR